MARRVPKDCVTKIGEVFKHNEDEDTYLIIMDIVSKINIRALLIIKEEGMMVRGAESGLNEWTLIA